MNRDLAEKLADLSAQAYVDLIDPHYCLALTRWAQSQKIGPTQAAVNFIRCAGTYIGMAEYPDDSLQNTMEELLIVTFRHAVKEAAERKKQG